ncbi:hypothetical protein UABAM_05175 [Candidatus Uabimicrobium amorphum]|uniref:Uncharacterized protein n=1 Tax=Uabimicrobium amorphum TaxID=2596890 RepID=A0A5S9IS93_UABAM|nr:hypothetical protein UABAM_05175 [Candidatus Uabimicrobium amorphum]
MLPSHDIVSICAMICCHMRLNNIDQLISLRSTSKLLLLLFCFCMEQKRGFEPLPQRNRLLVLPYATIVMLNLE